MSSKQKRKKTASNKRVDPTRYILMVKKHLWGWVTKNRWHKLLSGVLAVFMLITIVAYSIAQWYISSQSNKPLTLGVTFVPNYSRYFGIDPEETMQAMVKDLGFKRFRLVSYWSTHEPVEGFYDFSELDWQFDLADQEKLEVSLAIGLRQPRWPECHMPEWAKGMPKDEWYPKLKDYMRATVERYKDRPSLKSYQLENEFLLQVFGDCPDHDPERLSDEFAYLRVLDGHKPIIINRSNNATPSWPINEPLGDEIGAAIYKRVWDKTLTKRYFEYPIPAWYYAFLAGGTKLTTGRDTFIHELQTEPWQPDGVDLRSSPIEEQNNTMDAKRLKERFHYAKGTGMRTIDVWGAEWWYWRKVNGDSSLWDTARTAIIETQIENQQLTR